MSRGMSMPVLWVCVALYVWLHRTSAQPTIEQCHSDEGSDRQVVFLQQMISKMNSMNDRQMALMEQMHSTLRSVDGRMEEANEGVRCISLSSDKRASYKFVQNKVNWNVARTYCRNLGLPAKCAICHTSGMPKLSGVWQWTAQGEAFQYTNWEPAQPDGNGKFCYIRNVVPGWDM